MQALDPTTPVLLAFSGAAAVPVEGASRLEGGLPVRRFRKELIRVGKYIHPNGGYEFDVTPETLDHWALTFGRMKEAGVKIAVPEMHPKDPKDPEKFAAVPKPSENRGWMASMVRDGNSLFGEVDLVGEGIKLAATSDVSIYSPATFADASGNVWKRPIMHVALCTDPVITGLGGFVPIAASQGAAPVQVPVLQLQIEGSPMPDEINPPASPAAGPKDAIREAIKQQVLTVMDDDSIDDVTAFKKIKDLFKARAKALGVLESMDEPADKSAATSEEPAVAASRSAVKPSPMVLRLSRENRQHKFDERIRAGNITPASAAKLAAIWLPASDEALALSLSQDGCDQFDAMIAALAENDPVKLSEQTGPQSRAVVLSRGNSDSPEAKKIREEMAVDVKRFAGIK